MCKKHINVNNISSDDMEVESDSDMDSSLSSESGGSESEVEENEAQESVVAEEEPPEDEVITAIKRECERKNDHPPIIQCEDFVTDISFHPYQDLLAVADIVGDVKFYKFSIEENVVLNTLELHRKACRDIEFSHDGRILFSTSKDKSIVLSDVETGKFVRFYEDSHDVPIYSLVIIDENQFATGDDDGTIKIWDTRQKDDKPIYKTKKNEDYISDMVTNDSHKYLICASGDGSLTTIDLEKRCVFMQSEEYDEELTCLGLFRNETKVLAGSSKGKLYLYNWQEFGYHSDAFPGPKAAIHAMVPITENIAITACEDGNLRATHLFPHRHLGIVGQHEMSVETLDISNNGNLVASSGHNNEIKFWNVQYFEDFERVSHKHKKHERKKDLANNLPSSKMQNTSDFFNDLS